MTTLSNKKIRQINNSFRKSCIGLIRADAIRIFGRVRWEVRSAPVTTDLWDGTTWNLLQLQRHGKPGERYRADAYKPENGELPVATYEIIMPSGDLHNGAVFREAIAQKDGLTEFRFVEVNV